MVSNSICNAVHSSVILHTANANSLNPLIHATKTKRFPGGTSVADNRGDYANLADSQSGLSGWIFR